MKLAQVTQIFNGWANLVLDQFNLLEPEFKKEAEKRLLICDSCSIRSGNSCDSSKEEASEETFLYTATNQQRIKGENYKGCGCQLSAKTVCKNCQCPLGKWLEYKEKENEKGK